MDRANRVPVRPLPGGLHGHPPLTPAAVLLRWRFTLPLLLAGFLTLAVLARVNGGGALLSWDRPIQRWAEAHRGDDLNSVFNAISQLGGLTVVTLGLILLLYLVYRRCHPLGTVLLVAVIARPPLEWTLKEMVGRERPDFERLVPGVGNSFPTGHVMAAVALWGLVPPVVALLSHRRTLWWVSVALSGTVVLAVGASRVYLGVHWFSDVVGALLLGSLYLLAVEWLLEWHHDRRGCEPLDEAERDLVDPEPATPP